MDRRSFITRTAAWTMAGLICPVSLAAANNKPGDMNEQNFIEVKTKNGRLRGRRDADVAVFKGIPYAAPPTAEYRFRSPQPVRSWRGVRDALDFGPAAIQTIGGYVSWVYTTPQVMDEDCLTLNVWSPDTAGSRPVIVWIHGGGYRTGSSSMPAFDGTRYAQTGDVVFVSINYRLGVLGWAAHPDLSDPESGHFANWAILDQMAALRWVRANIAAFGGDPGRITVMGESGGAINGIMMAHESTEPLFHQLIAMSPPHICPPATLDMDGWKLVMEDLATGFGTTVAGLRQVDPYALHQAELKQFNERRVKTPTGRAYRGTVVDGRVLTEWPAYYALPGIPTLIGCIGVEGASRYNFFDPIANTLASPPAPDEATIKADIAKMMGALYELTPDKPDPAAVIDHYRQSARQDGRADDMATAAMELFGDMGGRHYAVRKAEQAAAQGRQDVYFYQYSLPLMPPNHEPAHATELSVVFGTFLHPHYRPKIGDGELQQAVSQAIISAFTAFAVSGRPAAAGLPAWPHFSGRDADVMVFGQDQKVGTVTAMPKSRQLAILDPLAGLRS